MQETAHFMYQMTACYIHWDGFFFFAITAFQKVPILVSIPNEIPSWVAFRFQNAKVFNFLKKMSFHYAVSHK